MICEYDAASHEYRVDGRAVPSVTQLVSIYGDDIPADDALELTFEAAAERGTMLHGYLAWRLDGNPPAEYELPDEYAEYKEGVEQFLFEHDIAPLLIETPLYDKEFAGTPDLICSFDGVDTLIDYKFVSTLAKTKVGAQLAGYRRLLANHDIYVDKLLAVQFGRDGYRIYPADDMRDAFDIALAVWRMRRAPHRRGQIGYKGD